MPAKRAILGTGGDWNRLKTPLHFISICLAVLVFAAGVTAGAICYNARAGRGGYDAEPPAEMTAPPAEDAAVSAAAPSNVIPDAPAQHAAATSTAAESTTEVPLTYVSYRVKEGDIIGRIANSFGVTQDTIISVNNIRASRLLQIGQYLKIPSMSGIIYTVKEDGETAESVAALYEADAARCAEANGVGVQESLAAGVAVFVPGAELDWVTRQEINGDLFQKPLHSGFYFSSRYGWRQSPFNTARRTFHSGVDMACAEGTAIYAALPGRVAECGWSNTYGNYVIVSHHSGYRTLYGHMSRILVSRGQYVDTTTVIGRVGNTGLSTGPHLHFTVYKNGRTVDPTGLWG